MKQSISNLKLAERGAIISISTYLLLSTAKLATGHLLHSSSLVADGFNNVSDIIGNVALLIGIRMARQPADRDHRFGHWKIEDLASLITSIIMFYVGFDVLRDTIQKILSHEETVIDPLGACTEALQKRMETRKSEKRRRFPSKTIALTVVEPTSMPSW